MGASIVRLLQQFAGALACLIGSVLAVDQLMLICFASGAFVQSSSLVMRVLSTYLLNLVDQL